MFRVGIGWDQHAMVSGRPLVLGGERFPGPRGLSGHSDADVLVHAVCDAVLGASGLPDLGRLFPDDDPELRGANSLGLLAQVARRIPPVRAPRPGLHGLRARKPAARMARSQGFRGASHREGGCDVDSKKSLLVYRIRGLRFEFNGGCSTAGS